nr:MAG TPA: hypothetical protein [Caudoviricetes sp.]
MSGYICIFIITCLPLDVSGHIKKPQQVVRAKLLFCALCF